MGFDIDDEILQDFLVEAGEILEQLQEQLVDLENNPTDSDLLNAIFRGFHTVKGGAGFLSLTHLVDACHGAENVFDKLRNGELAVTSELMDVILQTLDTVNDMFSIVQAGEELTEPAPPELLAKLEQFLNPEAMVAAPEPVAEPEPVIEAIEPAAPSAQDTFTSGGGIDSLNQGEFELLVSGLDGQAAQSVEAAPAPVEGDNISDDVAQVHGSSDD